MQQYDRLKATTAWFLFFNAVYCDRKVVHAYKLAGWPPTQLAPSAFKLTNYQYANSRGHRACLLLRRTRRFKLFKVKVFPLTIYCVSLLQSIDVSMSDEALKQIAESLGSSDSACILHKYKL